VTFPTIPTSGAGQIVSSANTNPAGTHTFPNLNTLTAPAGTLIIALCIIYDGNSTNAEFSSWGGGFTEFVDQATTTTMGIGAAYKWSSGSETGTFTVTSADTSANDSVCLLLAIPGAHPSTPPEGGTIANGTAAAANIAALNPAGWDAEDTLWIAVCGAGETSTTGSFTAPSAAPANYGDLFATAVTADVVGGVYGAGAFRQLNAASDDPATFTVDTSNARNSALLLAVRPAPPLNPVHETHTLVAGFTSDTSITLTEPSGYSSDDIMVVKLYLNTNKTVTPPATGSWAQPTNANATIPTDGYQQQIWWKRGDVGGGLTFSWTGATGRGGSAHRISGAVTSGDPWDGTPDHQTTSTGATDSPTVTTTTTVANTLLLHFRSGSGGSSTWAPSSGYTEVYETLDFTADWIAQAASGSSGSVVGTHGTTDRQAAFLGALKPAGGDVTVEPAVIATAAALPNAARNVAAGPAVIARAAALAQPTLNVAAGPAGLATVAAVGQPSLNVVAGPAVIARAAVLPQATPTISGDVTATPAAVAALAALAQPTLNVAAGPAVVPLFAEVTFGFSANTTASPDAVAAVAVLPQATPDTGSGNATPTPTVIAAVAALPNAARNVVAGPAVISSVASLPGPGISIGASPAVLGALAALQRPLVDVAAGPAVIARVVVLPGPTVLAGGSATVTPTVVAALAALTQPAVNVRAGPSVLAALAALGLAQAGQSIVAAPAVIARAVTIPPAGASVGASPAVIALAALLPLVTNAGGEPVPGYGHITIGVAAGLGLVVHPTGGVVLVDQQNGELRIA
jgi:hypothetical protein